MQFKDKSLGAKLVIISTIAALLTHLFPWVEFGILSSNGFSQTSGLFMLLFIYPFYNAITDKKINKIIGVICAILAIFFGLGFVGSKQDELFGRPFNASGSGVYLFIFCAVVLIFGVIKMNNAKLKEIE